MTSSLDQLDTEFFTAIRIMYNLRSRYKKLHILYCRGGPTPHPTTLIYVNSFKKSARYK